MVGLEIHVPLPTRSKLFCACPLPARDAEPNSTVCPTCLGHPGSRPRTNRHAVELAVMLAKGLGCRILPLARFSRKTYFYPDMGKNFQITQYEEPIGLEGHLEGAFGRVRIRRVQVEEDPARIVHGGSGAASFTLLDYNRSGTPLCEVVTEPDLASAESARAFLVELRALLDTLGLLPDESNLRADCNVSTDGGARVEVKNVQGLRNAQRSIEYEVRRQRALRERGLEVARATMHFDEGTGTTVIARAKESEEDYGYIVEPDLPPFPLQEFADSISLPALPYANVRRLVAQYAVSDELARVLAYGDKGLLNLAERLAGAVPAVLAMKWVGNELRSQLEKRPDVRIPDLEPGLTQIFSLLAANRVIDGEARRLIGELVNTGQVGPIREVSQDTHGLDDAVQAVLAANPRSVDEAKRDDKVLNFLVGLAMKATKGAYAPKLVLERVKALMK